MTETRKNITRLIPLLLVFTFAFSVRLYFIDKKEGLFMDEVLSVTLSNYSDCGWLPESPFDENKIYTGKFLKESCLWNKTSFADAFSDIGKLYLDNRDRPHTNLYYSCFRLWFAGIATTDVKEIIQHGCKLNLLFFVFSFFFLYKLLRKLFDKDDLLTISTLFIAFLNTGAISNTVFLRPYQLQETCLVIFTYIFVSFYEKIKSSQKLFSVKNLFKIIFATGFTLLSGYFAIYIIMLFVILAFVAKRREQNDNLKFLGIAFLASVVFARLLFCGFFYGFSCGHAGEAYRKFGLDVLLCNFVVSCRTFAEIIAKHLFGPMTIILVVVSIGFARLKNTSKLPLIIVSCCFIWSFGNIFLADNKELRYIMACFPLLAILIPYLVQGLNKLMKYIFVVLISLSTLGYNVDYLFIGQKKEAECFTKDPNIPVIVLTKIKWKYSMILHLFADEQQYEFPCSINSLNEKIKKYDRTIVLFSDDYNSDEIKKSLPKNYTVNSENTCCAFEIFSVENK